MDYGKLVPRNPPDGLSTAERARCYVTKEVASRLMRKHRFLQAQRKRASMDIPDTISGTEMRTRLEDAEDPKGVMCARCQMTSVSLFTFGLRLG